MSLRFSSLVVTVPATSHDLTTLAIAKDELGITDKTADARLTRWITEASGLIEGYTRRVFARETVQETWQEPADLAWTGGGFPGSLDTGCAQLRLRRYPVTSITSIVEDADAALSTDDYQLDADTGLLYRMAGQTAGVGGYRCDWAATRVVVTYTAGYASVDDLPAPVTQACLTLISHRNASRGRDPMLRQLNIPGVQEESYWVGAVGDNGAVPPAVQGLLDMVRSVSV